VHEYNINRSLPNLLRVEDSIFATEGFAMMMERLAENAAFYRAMALVDETTLAKLGAPMEEKERMQGLIFSRWTQVMLRFEKDLYANPEKDLDALWWRLVERYQGIKRPAVPFRSAAGSAANSRPSSSRSPGRLVQAMAVE
jgi:peptidyl-dipeptidase A